MRIKVTLLTAGGIAGLLLAATLALSADLRPAIATALSGTLRIQQPIPCSGMVDQTTPVTGGRVELTPAEGIDAGGGARSFTLTRANLTFAPFTVGGSCAGVSESDAYGPVRVQLVRAVSFTATPTATPEVFAVSIPRDRFRVDYVTTVDGAPEAGTKHPREDVRGTIDLAGGTLVMRVVLGTRVTFRALCLGDACAINETHDGTLTANVTGVLQFPDTDGDGVADRVDNCRFTANADQALVATPTIVAPPPVTLNGCLSRAFGAARGADVCNGLPVTVTNDAPLRFDVGPNLVTWRATDSMSRVATATQTVTIADTTPPTFTSVPADLSLTNCGPAALGLPTATDECAGAPTFSNNAPASFHVGTTPVTWTATDASGNDRTAVQTVTVVDTVAPAVTCAATSPTGNAFRVASSDACLGAPTIRLGTFVLAEGETIHINETGQPGVGLVNRVGADGFRHFHVGRGEAVVTATDASGNVGSTVCPVR